MFGGGDLTKEHMSIMAQGVATNVSKQFDFYSIYIY